MNHGGAVEGNDGATPSIPRRRFFLKGNKIQEGWACAGIFTVGKTLFTTKERMYSCIKEALRMVYIRDIMVRMYYFLTLHDTFLILPSESVSLKSV